MAKFRGMPRSGGLRLPPPPSPHRYPFRGGSMLRRSLFYVCLLATLSGLTMPALGQEVTSGTIHGTGTADKGKPIADAVVTAMSPPGARKAVTDKNGYFIIPFLTPGIYSVQVIAAGSATVVQDGIVAKLTEKTRVAD